MSLRFYSSETRIVFVRLFFLHFLRFSCIFYRLLPNGIAAGNAPLVSQRTVN